MGHAISRGLGVRVVWMVLSLAWAGERPSDSLTWQLSVDGVHVGWRQVDVRWADDVHRVFTGHTTIDGHDLDGPLRKLRYEQHLSANSQEGRPASFTSVIDAGGGQREIQARRTGTTWTVSVTDGGNSRMHSLPHTRVDLSSVDLMDPEAERRLTGRAHAAILLSETGKIEEGAVQNLGEKALSIGGETMLTQELAWTTSQGVYRFWYAQNGWLVRWQAPILGLQVLGELVGEAPRGSDEFPVPVSAGVIEVFEL